MEHTQWRWSLFFCSICVTVLYINCPLLACTVFIGECPCVSGSPSLALSLPISVSLSLSVSGHDFSFLWCDIFPAVPCPLINPKITFHCHQYCSIACVNVLLSLSRVFGLDQKGKMREGACHRLSYPHSRIPFLSLVRIEKFPRRHIPTIPKARVRLVFFNTY